MNFHTSSRSGMRFRLNEESLDAKIFLRQSEGNAHELRKIHDRNTDVFAVILVDRILKTFQVKLA
jgi:hypothetical protein